jgi:hypothetical protein
MYNFYSVFFEHFSYTNFIHVVCQRAMLVSVSCNNKVGKQTDSLVVFVLR